MANIENSRKAPLDRVINAIGIRHVGEHTARQLAIRFGTLDALAAASEDELTSVRDIGAEVAHSIREYFDEPRNLKAIKRLEKELHIEKTRVAEGRGPFRDKTFVLTGTLETMTREEAEQKILEGGGRVSGSVSRKTDFVVVGADPGLKARKALRAGCEDTRRERVHRDEFVKPSVSDDRYDDPFAKPTLYDLDFSLNEEAAKYAHLSRALSGLAPPGMKLFRPISWYGFDGLDDLGRFVAHVISELGRLGLEVHDIERHDRPPNAERILSDLLDSFGGNRGEGFERLIDWQALDLNQMMARLEKILQRSLESKSRRYTEMNNLSVRWHPGGWRASVLDLNRARESHANLISQRKWRHPPDFHWFTGDDEPLFDKRPSNELMYIRGWAT